MGGITYNGVEGDGGNIFKDMKFWVAKRIPTRDRILALIKQNGGQVVPLEKDAFLLIADNVRKDAPQNSYSWKYITDSVDHGVAQLTDRYSIWGDSELPGTRTTGGGAPTKARRTPFTKADDAVLANWVLSHTKGRTGNAIYKEFAETHPQHTWQSWRNRFVKTLMPLPISELKKMAVTAADVASQSSRPSSAKQSPRNEQKPSKSPKTPASKADEVLPNKDRGSGSDEGSTIHAATSEISGDNRSADGQPADEEAEQEEPAAGSTDARPTEEYVSDEAYEAMREEFRADLKVFLEECGGDATLERDINGQMIDLWDLYVSVTRQQAPFEEVDWEKVAHDFEYDKRQIGRAKKSLKHCYETVITGFLEALAGFRAEAEAEEASPLAHRAPAPDATMPSSPPGTKKRSPDRSPSAGPSRKRRRQREEIPSTPEERLGISSTSSKADSGSHESEDEHVVFETQIQPVSRLETQLSSLDVTPSQQLRSEAINTSPIPLQLDPPTQRLNTSSEMKKKIKERVVSRKLPASFVSPADSRAKQPAYPNRVKSAAPGNSQAIQDCVEYYESLGYPRDVVIESLMRTTMTPGWPATMLMGCLQSKEGIPNCEGVWTDRDDRSLHQADEILSRKGEPKSEKEVRKAHRHLERITHKHGKDNVGLRRQFLAAQEAST